MTWQKAVVKWTKHFCLSVFAFVFAIVGMTLFLTTYSFVSILSSIYKAIVILVAKFKMPSAEILRPLDGIMTTKGEVYRATHNYMTQTWVLEGELNIERFKEEWMERVMKKRYPNGRLQFPQLQQHIQKFAGYNFWVYDTSFNVDNYILVHEENPGEKVDKEKLIEIRTKFQRRLLRKGHALWEMLLVKNYQHNDAEDKKHSALIFKLHHSLGDGFSLAKLFWIHFSKTPIVEKPKSENENARNKFKSVLYYLALPILVMKAIYTYPFDFVYNRDRFFDNNPWHTHTEKSLRKYDVWIPEPLNKSSFREIKAAHGVSTMSVIVTVILGGIRRMMLQKNLALPKYMRVSHPIPLPKHPDYLTNHARMVEFLAPVGNPNPTKRLLKTNQNIQKCISGPYPVVLGLITWLAGYLPYKFHRMSSDYRLCSVYIPCLPMPAGECAASGCRIISMNSIFYVTQSDCGVIVSVMGYNENFHLSLQIDSTLLKSADEVKFLENYILEELNALKNDSTV